MRQKQTSSSTCIGQETNIPFSTAASRMSPPGGYLAMSQPPSALAHSLPRDFERSLCVTVPVQHVPMALQTGAGPVQYLGATAPQITPPLAAPASSGSTTTTALRESSRMVMMWNQEQLRAMRGPG